jgi:hypothetical protein
MPATEIAGVMERMRARQEASATSGSIGPHVPPGYDMSAVGTADEMERVQIKPHASGKGSSGLVRTNIA